MRRRSGEMSIVLLYVRLVLGDIEVLRCAWCNNE